MNDGPDWSKVPGKGKATDQANLPTTRDIESLLDAINQRSVGGQPGTENSGGATGMEANQLLSQLVQNTNEMLELLRIMAGDEEAAHG